MTSLTVAHTGQLDPALLNRARKLLDEVFEGELTDDDWEHALGGMHALAFEGNELVGHASLVQRRLIHGGRALRAGYVEAVGVHPAHRRRGVGDALMQALEDLARRAYDVAALGATDVGAAFYVSRGWVLWRGPTFALTLNGRVRTPEEDDCIHVLPLSAPLDLDGELTCDFRDGDAW